MEDVEMTLVLRWWCYVDILYTVPSQHVHSHSLILSRVDCSARICFDGWMPLSLSRGAVLDLHLYQSPDLASIRASCIPRYVV
jgi:hypothetical protein